MARGEPCWTANRKSTRFFASATRIYRKWWQTLLRRIIDPRSAGRKLCSPVNWTWIAEDVYLTTALRMGADVVVNTAGTRLYVGDGSGVFVFPLDPATGDVTGAGVLFSTGDQTTNLAINPTNTRLYVAAGNSSQMFALVIDAAGDITGQAPGSPFTSGGPNPTGMAVR